MSSLTRPWPQRSEDLVALQHHLGRQVDEMVEEHPWDGPADALIGGCFVAFARGEAGPGHPGDRAWAAAVTWRPGTSGGGEIVACAVVGDRVPASYAPGLLALREGPILAAAVEALTPAPDVLLVDATGLDHPRRAGLAVHLGAALAVATVGVTHRGLGVPSPPPAPAVSGRGDVEIVSRSGRAVAAWLYTRTSTRPLLVHPGWRTGLDTAVQVVLRASSEAARTPAPLRQARQAARAARTEQGGG